MSKSKDRQKQPWLKFFPADWRQDTDLSVCSLAARGLWIEMLAVMWQADPCGSLVHAGQQMSIEKLALSVRATVKETKMLLTELQAANVFSVDEDGTIYSRRMRRDIKKAEQDRENGRGGGNPSLKPSSRRRVAGAVGSWVDEGVNPDLNHPDNVEDKARGRATADASEARSHKPEAQKINTSPPAFEPGREAGGRAVLSDEFVMKLRKAVTPEPVAGDQDYTPIAALVTDGATEADVLEGIRIAFAKRTDPEPFRLWSAFVGWIERVVSGRAAGRRRPASGDPATAVEDGPKVRLMNGRPFSVALIREADRTGKWFRATMGPKRGEAGCLVPAWVFEEVAA